MAADDALDALRHAVAALPDDPALRLHLAEQLGQAGRGAEALAHALVVQDQGYGGDRTAAVIAAAHGSTPGPPTPPAPPTAPTPPAAPTPPNHGIGDEVDDLLRLAVAADAADRSVADRAELRFDDLVALDSVVDEVRRTFLMPLRDPARRQAYGLSAGGGLLLYGPPGCGKTLVARALAGEADARFLPLSFADLISDHGRSAPEVVQRTFAEARRLAPAVLFLDEVDAVGPQRTQVAGEARAVVTQLLQEMDGVDVHTESVLVLGATNQPWTVDPALRRPGRFDRALLVLPPDRPGRAVIIEHHLRGRPVGRVDHDDVARRTDRYSGADLRLVCDVAASRVAAQAQAGARPLITTRDLRAAVREVRPSIGPWLEVARNFATFANGSGEYDELLAYLRASGRRR